jgi:DNA repair exonuclease SbcCD ATPase subunit
LPDGEAVAVDGPVQFDIEGIGTLTVSPGAGAASGDLDQRLAKAGQARADLLGKIGVDSPDAARVQARRAGEYRQAAALATERLDTLAPKGLDALRTEVATLQSQAEDLPEQTESLDILTERHRLAAVARGQADAARDAAQAGLNTCETALATSETNLSRSREALQRDQAALGESGDSEARLAHLTRMKAEATTSFEDARVAAEALRAETPDLASLQAAKARIESVVTRTEAEIQSLGRTISELDGRIGTRAEEGIEEELAEVEGRLSRAEAHRAGLETECAALQRLRDVLTGARTEAKEHFFEPVMAELRPLLSLVFGDAAVSFDEKTLLPVSVERGGAVESFEVLSGGMREQITILTRLAFARLLAEGGSTVPVILDDALIYSDDARIERMFDALHRQATDLQIIVFTCRQRAFRALGGREMQVTAWSPEDVA